jgi:hypothetical protein
MEPLLDRLVDPDSDADAVAVVLMEPLLDRLVDPDSDADAVAVVLMEPLLDRLVDPDSDADAVVVVLMEPLLERLMELVMLGVMDVELVELGDTEMLLLSVGDLVMDAVGVLLLVGVAESELVSDELMDAEAPVESDNVDVCDTEGVTDLVFVLVHDADTEAAAGANIGGGWRERTGEGAPAPLLPPHPRARSRYHDKQYIFEYVLDFEIVLVTETVPDTEGV